MKRAQPFPLLSSESFSRTRPQSPLSCVSLLVQASGIITAVLVVWVLGRHLHALHAHAHPQAILPLVLSLGWSLGTARLCRKPVFGMGVCPPRAAWQSRVSGRTMAQFHACEWADSGASLTLRLFEHTHSCLSVPVSCRLLPSLHPLSGPAHSNSPGPFPTQGFSPLSWALPGNVQFLNTHVSSPVHGSALWKASFTGKDVSYLVLGLTSCLGRR